MRSVSYTHLDVYKRQVYKKLNEIIASGQLGRLNLIQVNFGSYKDYNMTNRFFSRKLAGEMCIRDRMDFSSLSIVRSSTGLPAFF